MPGAFHTEIVPDKGSAYRVYLVDLEFKNPKVTNSKVDLSVIDGSKTIPFICKAEADSFLCSTDKKLSGPKEIVLTAKRDGAQGNEAKYSLPLKPWKK